MTRPIENARERTVTVPLKTKSHDYGAWQVRVYHLRHRIAALLSVAVIAAVVAIPVFYWWRSGGWYEPLVLTLGLSMWCVISAFVTWMHLLLRSDD